MIGTEAQRGPAPAAWGIWLWGVAFAALVVAFEGGASIIGPTVQKDLQLSLAEVNRLAMVTAAAFLFFQILGGALLDRVGTRRLLPAAVALVVLGILLFTQARSYPLLAVAWFLVAAGASCAFVGAAFIGAEQFGLERFGFMLGLTQFATSLVSAFNQDGMTRLLRLVAWRSIFIDLSLCGMALFVLGVIFLRAPSPYDRRGVASASTADSSFAMALSRAAASPQTWLAAAIGAASYSTMLALGVAWSPTLLRARGLEVGSLNWPASVVWLGMAFGCFALPLVSDSLRKRKPPMLAGLTVQAAALMLLLYAPRIGYAAAMALCFAFGAGSAVQVLAFSAAVDRAGPRSVGASIGLVSAAQFVAATMLVGAPGHVSAVPEALQPSTLALAREAATPALVMMAVALVLVTVMRETYPALDDPRG